MHFKVESKFYKEKNKKLNHDEFYREQSERVSLGGYAAQPLLNRTETIARKAIWKIIYEERKSKTHQLFAQVCLGEILSHQNKRLYLDISGKRVDFVVTDAQFNPLFVIEIQGQGHYKNHAEKRDSIKRKAIESAGLSYIGIAVGTDEQLIADAVSEKVKEALSNSDNE